MSPLFDETNGESSPALLNSLLSRSQILLDSLSEFQSLVQQYRKGSEVDIRHFTNNVQSEAKSLQRLAAASATSVDAQTPTNEEAEAKQAHVLRSSNLPFYETVWDVARHCRGLKALEKRVYWSPVAKKSKEQSVDRCHERSPEWSGD